MFFGSDNTAGISAPIMAAIQAANEGHAVAYGNDDLTKEVEKRLADLFEIDVTVALVSTGTAANALALSCLVQPYGAVICHVESHIMVDECGAPELYSGAKLVGVPGHGCKLTADSVAATLERVGPRAPHHVKPQAVSLTQATELGTVYTPGEVSAISDVARRGGLAVHMDGARFANAVTHLGCTPAEITWQAGVDVLFFGATKAGALAAEAVVAFGKVAREDLSYRRKRGGHLISKGRFLAAQWIGFLENDHWRDLTGHANVMASRLAAGFHASDSVRVPFDVQANEVFAVVPKALAETLSAAGCICYDWSPHDVGLDPMPGDDEIFLRFVCSFETLEEEVDRVVGLVSEH